VKDLVGAFAQFPHLPKMLNTKAILDTLVAGCQDGLFVLRLTRPDRSVRTFWRARPDEVALKDPSLEVILSEEAELADIAREQLAPKVLPGLWEESEVTFGKVCEYFSGGQVVKIPREGYEEPITVPKAERELVDGAVRAAVEDGTLWLTAGPASILAEEVPPGILNDEAVLQAPPQPIPPLEIVPDTLPDAWDEDTTTALSISVALTPKAGKTVPWATVRQAIDGALKARYLETTEESGDWPCDLTAAKKVILRVPKDAPPPKPPKPEPGVRSAEAVLRTDQIQDLADVIGEVAAAAVGQELTFKLHVALGGGSPPPEDVLAKVNEILAGVSEDLRLD
jgi:hypothetical protein